MPFELSFEEGAFLIKLAKRAVEEHLKSGEILKMPESVSKRLMEPTGVFVTLNFVRTGEKELRGCIGFPYPTLPLGQAVIESSINSATKDPRFSPVHRNELDQIVFEVSVLTPPRLVEVKKPAEYPSRIIIGKHGLIIEREYFKGLLLPQVPVERNWDEEDFLCNCCLKANLSPDCWLLKGTKVYTFSCVIAKELSPNGEIVIEDMRKGS
jgi:hypothetical protein